MEILGGPYYAVAGAGESHGPGITTIVYGCPPGFKISREAIQVYLDRRRPGGTRHGTPRQEKDKLLLLSGLYQEDHVLLTSGPELQAAVGDALFSTPSYEEGYTTGEPISAVVLSTGTRSSHYTQFEGSEGEVRPGHTDLVKYYQSGGNVDIRGGGRSSYRSTISDVIGGSVARIILGKLFGTHFLSSIVQVGPLKARYTLQNYYANVLNETKESSFPGQAITVVEELLEASEIRSLDEEFAREAAELIKQTRIDGDSLGALVEVTAVNVPPLVGEPLYNSLKARLMGTLGGLHAAQSCEIGDGLEVVARRGSENNDPIRRQGYQANSHGGLIGGITTGMPLVCRVGFKPTSSIVKTQQSVRKDLQEIDFQLKKGRHDPCVGVRAGVTLESRMAIELLNAVLAQEARQIDTEQFKLF
ncbi:MAG: chorismate synthase [Candidatus Promineifilaceae bacterium]|jgi:chorismate synthase